MTDKIYTAMVGTDGDANLYKVDVIRHDGKLWLVPHWLEAPSLGVSRPARMVRFDNQPHQENIGSPFGDYILNGPAPKALLRMEPLKEQSFSFDHLELPDIDVPASVRPLSMGKRPN
jgi:hypothetical protein